MSDYYIKGIKDDRFKVKNQKTLELSEDEINTLKDIDVTELFDTYNFLLKNEYPESDKNLNLPEDSENLNAYDYVTNLINTDELVLLQGDLNRMSGFTSFYPEGTDTIWVDTQDPKYSTTHNIIHELGHIQTTDDGENFKHNITKHDGKFLPGGNYESFEEMWKDWERLEQLINEEK